MDTEQTIEKPTKAWISLLYKPRETFRQILDYDPWYGVWGVLVAVALSGTPSLLVSQKLTPLLLGALILGQGIALFIGLSIAVGVTKIVGRLLGGKADFKQLLSANIWPTIPQMYANLLLVPAIHFYGFRHPIIGFISAVGYLYYCGLLAICLSETLKISLKKAWLIVIAQILTLFTVSLVIVIILFALLLLSLSNHR